jgi:hypothetical protein
MDTPNKTLKEVLDALINLQVIPPSRMGPIKTAVKQYAIILGYDDPDQCPINAYHLPDARRNRLQAGYDFSEFPIEDLSLLISVHGGPAFRTNSQDIPLTKKACYYQDPIPLVLI